MARENPINAASRFIDFYGNNGVVYGQNVSDFLASISMSAEFHNRLSSRSECPSRYALSALSWTLANASDLAFVILDGVQTPSCYGPPSAPLPLLQPENDEHGHKDGNNPLHVWGYGLLFVTLINLCALGGIIFLPFMGRRIFKLLMAFMVSLGIGSLMATALLVLLPECLQLAFIHEEVNKANSSLIDDHHNDHKHHHAFHSEHSDRVTWENFLSHHPWYLWRCCTVLGGIYMFFLLERMLKELVKWKGGSGHHGHSHGPPLPPASSAAAVSPSPITEATDLANFRATEVKAKSTEDVEKAAAAATSATEASGAELALPAKPSGGCCGGGGSHRLASVQPVAWMILLGDALHNFIDGLSIGAAFTRSTLSGVSICLAVLCEELPHELGDFAILLSAGMSMPMALGCNFLSACTCYLGFALGVFLGETGASVWVFAIATGMFLYISLVDMTPEVNNAMDEPEARLLGRGKIFLLQNLGLFAGFGVILLLAVYGGNIAVG